jgi:outer membrane protein TolC
MRPLAAACGALVLSACTSFSPDGGFSTVQQAARQHLGKDLAWARSDADQAAIAQRVQALLSSPLSADAAVQLALLNNRGLQAAFQDLGITEAELVQAGRLANPGFSIGRLRRGDELEVERSLHLNLARLISRPWTQALEARRFQQVQAQSARAVLGLAAETRKAWIVAVTADETLRYAQQVLQAAEAGAELARRMEQAGNFSALQRAREQAFRADAALVLTRATQARLAAREQLTRLLGLGSEQRAFTLPDRLPDLPAQLPEQPDVERTALAQRLDVQAARLAVAATAQQLGLTRRTRFVNVLELSALRNSSSDAPTQRGWELSFELPLFDWGEARVARAESVYMQALHQAADTAVQAQSEVRLAYAASRAAHALARQHADEIVPLRKRIADENLLRYNGMFIGVFELLADARAQIAGVNAAIEAKRDYWLAQADLDMALLGPPRFSTAAGPVLAPEAAAASH